MAAYRAEISGLRMRWKLRLSNTAKLHSWDKQHPRSEPHQKIRSSQKFSAHVRTFGTVHSSTTRLLSPIETLTIDQRAIQRLTDVCSLQPVLGLPLSRHTNAWYEPTSHGDPQDTPQRILRHARLYYEQLSAALWVLLDRSPRFLLFHRLLWHAAQWVA